MDEQGKEVFDAKVMSVLEHLSQELKTEVPIPQTPTSTKYKPSFLLAVDFAGSASTRMINQRVRWVDNTGSVIDASSDFSRRYDATSMRREMERNLSLGELTDEEFQYAVANSFWGLYWRGQVTGALFASFTAAPDVGVDFHRCQRLIDEDGWGMVLSPLDGRTVRVVVGVSIDGGRVTKFEKKELPAVCKNAMTSIRCRGYDWGDNIYIIWCHFPTVQDFLHSMAGVSNLVADRDKQFCFDEDRVHMPTTYRVQRLETADTHESLLKRTVQETIASKQPINQGSVMHAAKHGDVHALEFLIKRGGDVRWRNEAGYSALHAAALGGHAHIVERLLELGADVDLATNTGVTPAYIAAQENSHKSLEVLISTKADVNKAKDDGSTPAYIAAQENSHKSLEVLISAKADVNKAMNDGCTPAFCAAQKNHPESLEVLISAKADVNQARGGGATPANIAAQENSHKSLEVLISAKADVNKAADDGSTPLDVANDTKARELLRLAKPNP